MNHHDQHAEQEQQDMEAVRRAYHDAYAGRDGEGMLPPAALDDAIRAAARRAVQSGPRPAGANWLRRWTPQLAVAAVVVLSVSVVFVSVQERPELAPAPIQIALNRPAEPPAAPIPPMQTKIVEATGSNVQAVPQASIAVDALKKQKAMDSGDVQARRPLDAPPAKDPRSDASMPPPAAATPAPASPVYAPPPASTPPPAPAAAVAHIAPAPFPATVAEAVAPVRKEARADARTAVVQEAKPVGEKVAVAGALRSRNADDEPVKSVAPAVASPASTSAPAAPIAVAQAPAPQRLAPAAAAGASHAPLADAVRSNTQASGAASIRGFAKEEDHLSGKSDIDQRPGPWLKRLRELREQGKLKALRDELVRFRKAHPDVVLPKALTELPPE